MGQINRLKTFSPGTKAFSADINNEFDNIVNGHNATDDDLTAHKEKVVDSTSTDPTKDKHVSNKDLNDIWNSLNNKYNTTDVYSKAELQSVTDNSSGADKIGATPIATSPNTVQGVIEWLYNQMQSSVLGQIPDGSVTIPKLSFDPATQSELDAVNNSFAAHKTDYMSHIEYAASTGSANTYAITLNPAPISYVEGFGVSVKIHADSTGASTLNVNGLGAKPIKKANGTDVTNLKAGGVYTFRYASPNFILQGEGGSGDAQPSDVLSPRTFTNDSGDQQTGTMANRGAMTITPGTTNQIIPEGYHNGSGIVSGDANLIAGNILSGKSIFGVAGNVVTGKRFATGTSTSALSTSQFLNAAGFNENQCPITVTGLSFKPSYILWIISGGIQYQGIYDNRQSLQNRCHLLYNINTTTSVKTYQEGGNPNALSVTNSGFTVPAMNSGVNYDWIAFE